MEWYTHAFRVVDKPFVETDEVKIECLIEDRKHNIKALENEIEKSRAELINLETALAKAKSTQCPIDVLKKAYLTKMGEYGLSDFSLWRMFQTLYVSLKTQKNIQIDVVKTNNYKLSIEGTHFTPEQTKLIKKIKFVFDQIKNILN